MQLSNAYLSLYQLTANHKNKPISATHSSKIIKMMTNIYNPIGQHLNRLSIHVVLVAPIVHAPNTHKNNNNSIKVKEKRNQLCCTVKLMCIRFVYNKFL